MYNFLEEIKKHPFGWLVAGIGLLAFIVGLIAAIASGEIVASIILAACLIGYAYFIYWQATKK